VISFERVSKRYPNGREALTDLSFAIHDGEMVFLTGRSGAGKSSVLKLIALLERPTRGQVIVNGDNTAKLPLRRVPLFRRGLGVVFQDHRLLMDRPVFDNVALPLIVADTSFREIEKRVRAALDQVGCSARSAWRRWNSRWASSSASASRAPSSASRRCWWPMSPPATSTPRWPRKSWDCSGASTRSASP
jgi:ABC-type ATPase involved in cell division